MNFRIGDKEKFERIKDMPQLKKEIVSYLFDQASRRERDRWWQYKGEFKYEDEIYDLECECRWDNIMFTYRNLLIERKQRVILVEDVLRGEVIL